MMPHHPEVLALREVLTQGENLLLSLDEVTYTVKVPAAFDATLGAHYRHCLDHFRSLFDSLDRDLVDYDDRKRDAKIETNLSFALLQTRELLALCERLTRFNTTLPLKVRCSISFQAAETPTVNTTLGREMMFCVSHAIHHYALIGMMCRILEVSLPGDFGMAPSTLKYLEKSSRALTSSDH